MYYIYVISDDNGTHEFDKEEQLVYRHPFSYVVEADKDNGFNYLKISMAERGVCFQENYRFQLTDRKTYFFRSFQNFTKYLEELRTSCTLEEFSSSKKSGDLMYKLRESYEERFQAAYVFYQGELMAFDYFVRECCEPDIWYNVIRVFGYHD